MQLSAPVWALRQLGDILYCGDARGMLFAYSWSQLTANSARLNDSKPVFEVSAFGVEPGKMNPHEVNSIETLGENKLIYGGAFDNAVRLADSERPDKVISTFNGHEGNVNELVTRSEHEFVSASEDGTVRVWDTRTAQASRLIRICDEPQLRRNGCGIGVCALDICGSLMVIFQ
ncbi:unnamed protein product [Toxocara canis]|uniref:WD_REPEATS_REGION domain-containing protein n=1 Tax=Toxocara canis TaxID=6265 RepID=A0A183U2E7_TOXCA|nr:unnamed protein product [Toxocara canis]